jgi:predicted ATP-dependent serine protease
MFFSLLILQDILDKIEPLSPRALIVDSIQTVYLSAFAGSAGNQVQVFLLVWLISSIILMPACLPGMPFLTT